MQSLEDELSFRIAAQLHELAKKKNFRLHPGYAGYALDCSFKESDFDVTRDDERKISNFGLHFKHLVLGRTAVDYLSAIMPYDSISQPEDSPVPNSYGSYRTAINSILNNLRSSDDELNYLQGWYSHKQNLCTKVHGLFELKVMQYIAQQHENMFVSVEGEIPNSTDQALLREVIREESIEPLRKIQVHEMEEGFSNHTQDFEKEIQRYIGIYLAKLSELKGYEPLNPGLDANPYEYFSQNRVEGFKSGEVLTWNFSQR